MCTAWIGWANSERCTTHAAFLLTASHSHSLPRTSTRAILVVKFLHTIPGYGVLELVNWLPVITLRSSVREFSRASIRKRPPETPLSPAAGLVHPKPVHEEREMVHQKWSSERVPHAPCAACCHNEVGPGSYTSNSFNPLKDRGGAYLSCCLLGPH